jgi:D,D-heptose 1,7-bisphosphate phosphatase
MKNRKKKAVFLDRDGTINMDKNGYINHPADFELYPFAASALALLKNHGFLNIVVSNQSGVARGYYTIADLDKIHAKMQNMLAESNANIDKIYFSPYHIEGVLEPYNLDHEDRKPRLGMFKKACDEFDINIKRSFMVGDRYTDIEFGKKAGLKTILVLTGDGEKEFYLNRRDWVHKPDFVVKDLAVAAGLIIHIDGEK